MQDGRKIQHRIDAAKGGLDYPMTDADLAAKLRAQISWRGIDLDADMLIASLETVEDAVDGAAFLANTRKSQTSMGE